ncbi:MAG: ATP-dependent Clp protease proteolytic subunit, partial [Holophagales bacterium]|nr:ATP-dependent Clp protease proteolytic subunit [Holophagales bacterium]
MTRASAPRFGLLSEGFVLGPFVLALLVLAPTLAWAGAGAAHGSPGPAAAGSLPATAPSAETSRAEDRRGEQLPEVAGAVGAPVAWMKVSSPIHPVVERYLELTLDRAREAGSQVLVVQLDTPGGSVASTRKLSQAFLGAELPVVVYVAPSGAQAASAGFFLLLAADVAAMAPGTNTGSAHPVSGGGGDIEGDMGEKLEQDTLALVRSLAGRHGRDADLAQTAVSESRSFTAEEALAAGLVDLVAADRQSLLTQLDGREVVRPEGEAIVLRTAGVAVIEHPIPAHLRLLAA